MGAMITSDPKDPRIQRGGADESPRPQNDVYLVLPEEERKKGFVRPYRDRYRHVGAAGPRHPLRDLTEQERARYAGNEYVKYEAYPDDRAVTGRFWTQAQLDDAGKGCGTETTMGRELSETYARNPSFYGLTYCVACMKHRPVAEFVWTADGSRVGS